jgi:hypothetical protein
MIPRSFFSTQQPGVLRLLSEDEWRCIGIMQSMGWEHYEIHGEYPRARQSTNPDCYRIQLLNLTYSCSGDPRTETSATPLHPDSHLVRARHSRFIQYYLYTVILNKMVLACWVSHNCTFRIQGSNLQDYAVPQISPSKPPSFPSRMHSELPGSCKNSLHPGTNDPFVQRAFRLTDPLKPSAVCWQGGL